MEHVNIAALRPTLDALDSKQIKAVVTLIWPYSSSQRQFALLLAEPDFRLRRKQGQVRARFCATSARALAATGVGIGDEVVLSLHGARFVQDGAVSTPGKSLDWELVYSQTVVVSVRRNGVELAHLELLDAAPTPAPPSPVKQLAAAPSPASQWSSPAFLKRARLSDGPFFEQPAYDPLADESHEGHDKKRRRKSYRDWTAWTYTARTPSPEKEDAGMDGDLAEFMSSPSRPPQLPKTPLSPSRTEPTSTAAEPPEDSEYIEETTVADSADGDTTIDEGELQKVQVPLAASSAPPKEQVVRDADYYELYSGPNEGPSLDSQYDFGGDTELNTEDEDDVEEVDVSATGLDAELEDEHVETDAAPAVVPNAADDDKSSPEKDDSTHEISQVEDSTVDEIPSQVTNPSIIIDDLLAVDMPPPTLPALHTDFATPIVAGTLTPIGIEPSSPNLKAVDSATLPLPSPFPGDSGFSYFGRESTDQPQVPLDGPTAEQQEIDLDADYIMETSFFSSINSSKAGGLHQDHETAYTPVRFTFGVDGTGWSRPLELSSPPPEGAQSLAADAQSLAAEHKDVSAAQEAQTVVPELPEESSISEQLQNAEDVTHPSLAETLDEDVADVTVNLGEVVKPDLAFQTTGEAASVDAAEEAAAPESSSAIVVSSDVDSSFSEDEDEVMAELEEGVEGQLSEESDSESDDEVVAESDQEHDIGAEDDELNVQQVMPISSQMLTEPHVTGRVEAEVGDQAQESQGQSGTQASVVASELADLGSLVDEGNDDQNRTDVTQPEPKQTDKPVDNGESARRTGNTEKLLHGTLDLENETLASTIPESFPIDDAVPQPIVQEPTAVVTSSLDEFIREPISTAFDESLQKPPTTGDHLAPPQEKDKPLSFVEADHTTASQVVPGHHDVKRESIEDGSLHLVSQLEMQDVSQQPGTELITELVTGIPAQEHDPGKSALAASPARNTRSRTKSATSPPQEDAYLSKLNTSMRRTRSKASIDSTDRDTASPTRSRRLSGSAVSPTQDAQQTSPYSLRSQSKHLSPDRVTASQTATTRRSSGKLVRRDTDFDIVPSQAANPDSFGSTFEPSQELGLASSQLSQGKFSDAGFVKDSEETTLHSENSISTVRVSDDGLQANDRTSDSVIAIDEAIATPRLRPPPLNLSQTQRQTRSRSRSLGNHSTILSPDQPPQTPRRSPRLTRSTVSHQSPRITRTTKALAQMDSPTIEEVTELQGESTPNANQQSVTYPTLPTEIEGHLQSSPTAPSVASHRLSPAPELTSAQRPPLHESDQTLFDTQQTPVEPPLSFQARQPEQSLLNVPEFTQSTEASATLHSFDIPLPGVQTQPVPRSPLTRTSPRFKPASTGPQPSSPLRASTSVQQSSDAVSEDEDATLVTKVDLPSVGLSTPLAYYTPLRDLIYFLNRSSQFHSSSNPDVLALCTSSSTKPEKAKKGPRHWNTTLHITDLSTFPSITTVNVFRPYERALPVCAAGDVILLRAFAVKSTNRQASLRSEDESSWCVWNYHKPVWGAKKGKWAELRAREQVKGPIVERGEGEWTEVEKLRAWYVASVRAALEEKERERQSATRETRSQGKSAVVEVQELGGDAEE